MDYIASMRQDVSSFLGKTWNPHSFMAVPSGQLVGFIDFIIEVRLRKEGEQKETVVALMLVQKRTRIRCWLE